MVNGTTRISRADYETLRELVAATHKLIGEVRGLYDRTSYEDLEHAVFGLQVVNHALEEVEENKGRSGHIEAISAPRAHRIASEMLRGVQKLQREAKGLLKTHPNEDLGTAIKALEIAKGSLEEVIEKYS